MKKIKLICCISVAGVAIILALSMWLNNASVNIPQAVNKILEENGVRTASIDKLGEYNGIKICVDEVKVTDSEVNEYVKMQMESFAEVVQVTDRDDVKEGDVVYVSYIVICEGKTIKQAEHDDLMVGAGAYNEQFEEALIGQRVGIPFSQSMYIFDERGNQKVATFNITIESINYFKTYELTDSFVKENFDMFTVQEYYDSCKKKLQDEKKREAEKIAEKEILQIIMGNCEFSVDQYDVAEYSMSFVKEQEQLAYVYNLDLNTYVEEILKQQLDEFYQKCYEYGEYEIKRYLVIGAIFIDLGYEVSDEEYRLMCKESKYDYDETKNDIYKDALICFKVMEREVLEYLLPWRVKESDT